MHTTALDISHFYLTLGSVSALLQAANSHTTTPGQSTVDLTAAISTTHPTQAAIGGRSDCHPA